MPQDKKEPICAVIITVGILIIIFFVSCLLPDQGPQKIKQRLEERGYSVEDIEFTCTNKIRNIYISSQPIEIDEGFTCQYWQIVSYGTFWIFQELHPYPDGWPKPVDVSITFEPKEYQELLKSAGDESIENYIKDKLFAETTE